MTFRLLRNRFTSQPSFVFGAKGVGAGLVSAMVVGGTIAPSTVVFCLASEKSSLPPTSSKGASDVVVVGIVAEKEDDVGDDDDQTMPSFSSSPSPTRPAVKCGVWVEGLPVFTAREVQQHNSRRGRVWVTFREGVYDVTDFLDLHPGGPEKIMLAAGRDVEAYWKSLPQHFEGVVGNIMEKYRVGNTFPTSGIRSRLAPASPSSISGGPMAWLSSVVWSGAEDGKKDTTGRPPPPPELRTEHDLQWESWKRAMKEGGGNLCEKEGVDNHVDARLAALQEERRRKQEELEAKRAQFSEAERERLSKLNKS